MAGGSCGLATPLFAGAWRSVWRCRPALAVREWCGLRWTSVGWAKVASMVGRIALSLCANVVVWECVAAAAPSAVHV